MFILTQKIINQRTASDYLQGIVTGPLGIGKTSFCIKTAQKYYDYMGESETESWNKALGCVLFSIDDIINHFKQHNWDNRAPITILDDASIHLGAGQWFINQRSVMELEGILTTGRTSTNCLLVNCPEEGGLMRYLRSAHGYRIRIKKEPGNEYNRVAIVKQPYYFTRRTGVVVRRYRNCWEDPFSVYLPNWVFRKYMKKRDKYKDALLKKLESRNAERPAHDTVINIMEEINERETEVE